MSICKRVFGGPLGIKRSRSSDREMPQFQPRIPYRQGQHRRMPKLWGAAYSRRGGGRGGCAMAHGDGPASGQAGLDRTGQAGQASECIGGQGCVEEQYCVARIEVKKQSPGKTATPPPASRLPTTPPPFAMAVVARLRDGDYSTTRVGSEWALGSRNEGYSRRGGFSAASVFSGLFCALL